MNWSLYGDKFPRVRNRRAIIIGLMTVSALLFSTSVLHGQNASDTGPEDLANLLNEADAAASGSNSNTAVVGGAGLGQSSGSDQGLGSHTDAILGAVTAGLSVLGQLTGNTTIQGLATVSSDVQQAIDGSLPPPTATSQGVGGSSGSYNGPHAAAVHALLNKFGEGPNPPSVAGPNTQRNNLLRAAIVAAWGADKEEQAQHHSKAVQMATMMHNDLVSAFNMRSNGAPITGATAGLIISEQELQRLAGE